MAIARALITAQVGCMGVTDTPGGGATFVVTVPTDGEST
jgi:K+-sensing histidine kinase KdpD